jgi:putative membrane protein insertion efficiency factor
MRRAAIAAIRAYQRTLSPDHGLVGRLRSEPFCTHEPTCSNYAAEAIATHGVRRGVPLAARRILRCGRDLPQHDPVPAGPA